MLAALVSLRDRLAFTLRCIHVEHGIRPPAESGGDAAFVRELCEQCKAPCTVVSVGPGNIAASARRRGIGIEAAARLYRMRALFREARRMEAETGAPVRILVAHTRDDMLETALMRILRGAGPAGLAAMPVSRGRILRPLLALDRAGVLRYLAERKLPWRDDSTNADTRFFRNRVRRRLIPLLHESFPGWRTGLAALAETQSLAAAYIRDEAASRVAWLSDGGSLYTGAEPFFAQSALIREEALFQGIDRLLAGRKVPATVKRAGIRDFSAGRVTAVDLGPARLWRDGGRVVLSVSKNRVSERGFSLLIKAPGFYTLERVTIAVKRSAGDASGSAGVFFALLPLALRPCFKGDCMVKKGRTIAARDWGRERERLVSVIDRRGVAAFSGAGVLISRWEMARNAGRDGADAEGLCMVTVSHNSTGGMDVQQSK